MKRSCSLASAESAMDVYMESEPSLPMQAYALRVQSHIVFLRGDREQSNSLREEASELDPYVSQMAGVPPPELFIPPTKIARQYRHMLRFF